MLCMYILPLLKYFSLTLVLLGREISEVEKDFIYFILFF